MLWQNNGEISFMRNNFLKQFASAKRQKKRLIYDAKEQRYLVTSSKVWQTWPKCTLIINFK